MILFCSDIKQDCCNYILEIFFTNAQAIQKRASQVSR